MALTAQATQLTNRIDTFALEHLGSNSEEFIDSLVEWNYDYFLLHRSFWITPGDYLNIEKPESLGISNRITANNTVILANGHILVA